MTEPTSLTRLEAENAEYRQQLRGLREQAEQEAAREQALRARIDELKSQLIQVRPEGRGESARPEAGSDAANPQGDPRGFEEPQQNAQVKRLVDANIIGIVIADIAGNLLDANDAFLEIIGYTRQDFNAGIIDWREITPREHWHRDEQGLAELWATGKVAPFEKDYIRKDGSRIPIVIGAAVLNPAARTWISFVLDQTERKQMEDELRLAADDLEHRVRERTAELAAANESLRYQAHVLENIGEAIVAIDPQYCITAWNRAATDIFGWKAEEVLGRPVTDIIAAAFRDRNLDEIGRQLAEGDTAVDQGIVWRRDGTSLVVESSAVRFRNSSGEVAGLVAINRDITARVQAEAEKAAAQEALAASQRRLQALFDHSKDAILLTDDSSRYVDVNPAACELVGRTREELLNSTVWDVTPIDDLERGHELWKAFIAAGSQASEYVLVRPDGTTSETEYLAVANILPGLHMSIMRDISERKRVERALQASEERYRSIFENSSDGIMLTAPDGRIFSANPAACAMLGRKEEEICQLGRDGFMDISDPNLAHFLSERNRLGHFRGELHAFHKDGHRMPVDVSSTIFEDKDGHRRTGLIFRDLSERAKAAALLEQRVEERTRALTALLEMSRNVASKLDLRPLLGDILAQLRNVVDYTGGAISILSGDVLVIASYDGPIPQEKMLYNRIPLDVESAFQQVMITRLPLIVDDVWRDLPAQQEVLAAWNEEIIANLEPIHSWMGVPLVAFRKLIGVLLLDHRDPGHFSEEDLRIVSAFADHAAVAIQNARLYEKAQQLAAMEERQRLGRDLHDSISQNLYGMTLGVLTAQNQLKTDPGKLHETLAYVLSLSETAFTDMRTLISELQPESAYAEALVAEISKQVNILRNRHNIAVTADLCDEPAASLKVKENVYRIAREALHNIVKHARASTATVRLANEEGILHLEIVDNGVGFDLTKEYRDHHGLRLMRDRTNRLDGSLEMWSEAGRSTRIRVRVPLTLDNDESFL